MRKRINMSMLQKIKSAFVYVPVLTWIVFMLSNWVVVNSYGETTNQNRDLEIMMTLIQMEEADKQELRAYAANDSNATNKLLDYTIQLVQTDLTLINNPKFIALKKDCEQFTGHNITLGIKATIDEYQIKLDEVEVKGVKPKPNTLERVLKKIADAIHRLFYKAQELQEGDRVIFFEYNISSIKGNKDAKIGDMSYKILFSQVYGQNIRTTDFVNLTEATFAAASNLCNKNINPQTVYKSQDDLKAVMEVGIDAAWKYLKDKYPAYYSSNSVETKGCTVNRPKTKGTEKEADRQTTNDEATCLQRTGLGTVSVDWCFYQKENKWILEEEFLKERTPQVDALLIISDAEDLAKKCPTLSNFYDKQSINKEWSKYLSSVTLNEESFLNLAAKIAENRLYEIKRKVDCVGIDPYYIEYDLAELVVSLGLGKLATTGLKAVLNKAGFKALSKEAAESLAKKGLQETGQNIFSTLKTEIKVLSKEIKSHVNLEAEYYVKYPNGTNYPYLKTAPVEDIVTSNNTKFVRLHDADNINKQWVINIDDFNTHVNKGGSLDELTDLLAIEKKPTKISLVEVPANKTIRKSVAAPQNWSGKLQKGGFTQYQIIGYPKNEPPIDWFSNTVDLNKIIK
jgi:hypothetical protein